MKVCWKICVECELICVEKHSMNITIIATYLQFLKLRELFVLQKWWRLCSISFYSKSYVKFGSIIYYYSVTLLPHIHRNFSCWEKILNILKATIQIWWHWEAHLRLLFTSRALVCVIKDECPRAPCRVTTNCRLHNR